MYRFVYVFIVWEVVCYVVIYFVVFVLVLRMRGFDRWYLGRILGLFGVSSFEGEGAIVWVEYFVYCVLGVF